MTQPGKAPLEEFVPVSSIEAGTIRSRDEPMGTVGIPVRDYMNTSTVLSLMGTDWTGLNVDLAIHRGNFLTLQRNSIISRMRGDWILFIDDDMVWQRDAAQRLVQSLHDLREAGERPDILGALCFRRSAPYHPTLYVKTKEGPYNFMEDWEGRYVEVDATGMAFCLVTVAALERIAGSKMPPLEDRLAFDKSPDFFRWSGSMGEDLRFCQDLRERGGRIIIDTDIHVEHMSESQRGYDDFLAHVADRDPQVTKMRRKVNNRMGLPTLSTAEAKRRLRGRS